MNSYTNGAQGVLPQEQDLCTAREGNPGVLPPGASSSLLHPQWAVLSACVFLEAFLSLA